MKMSSSTRSRGPAFATASHTLIGRHASALFGRVGVGVGISGWLMWKLGPEDRPVACNVVALRTTKTF